MLFRRNRKRRTAKQKAASKRNIKKAQSAVRRLGSPLRVRKFRVRGKKSGRVKARGARSTVRQVRMVLRGGRILTELQANRKRKPARRKVRRGYPSPVAKITRVAGRRVANVYGARKVTAVSYRDAFRGGKRYIGIMAQNRRRGRRFRRNEFLTGGATYYQGGHVLGMPGNSTYDLSPGSRMAGASDMKNIVIGADGKADVSKITKVLKRRQALAKARRARVTKKELANIRKQLAALKKIQKKAEAGMKRKPKRARKSGSAPKRRKLTKKQRRTIALRNLSKARRARKGGRKMAANRRRSTSRRRKVGRRHTGRKAARRIGRRRVARKAAPRRRKGRKMVANRRRRSVFGRRLRRNFSFSAVKAILPRAGVVLGGFVAHKFLTKVIGGLVSSFVPAQYSKTLVGAAVALGGFFAAGKFLPAHADTLGLGMLASFAEGAVRELIPSVAPMLGLGNSVSLLPRYSTGSYFEAAAGTPFVQAAAGEYFSQGGSIAQLNGMGEYFANELSIQGSGDYEVNSNYGTSGVGAVIDGIRPDGDLNSQFALMEAAAGLGTTSPTASSTYVPHENANAIGAGRGGAESGIFDQSGSNGILS